MYEFRCRPHKQPRDFDPVSLPLCATTKVWWPTRRRRFLGPKPHTYRFARRRLPNGFGWQSSSPLRCWVCTTARAYCSRSAWLTGFRLHGSSRITVALLGRVFWARMASTAGRPSDAGRQQHGAT